MSKPKQYAYHTHIKVVFRTDDWSRDGAEAIADAIKLLPLLEGDGLTPDTTVQVESANVQFVEALDADGNVYGVKT